MQAALTLFKVHFAASMMLFPEKSSLKAPFLEKKRAEYVRILIHPRRTCGFFYMKGLKTGVHVEKFEKLLLRRSGSLFS